MTEPFEKKLIVNVQMIVCSFSICILDSRLQIHRTLGPVAVVVVYSVCFGRKSIGFSTYSIACNGLSILSGTILNEGIEFISIMWHKTKLIKIREVFVYGQRFVNG